MEASPGIEPGYTDLQSAASPLRHEAGAGSLAEDLDCHKAAVNDGSRWSRIAIGRFETQAGTGNSTMHRLASALREIRKSAG